MEWVSITIALFFRPRGIASLSGPRFLSPTASKPARALKERFRILRPQQGSGLGLKRISGQSVCWGYLFVFQLSINISTLRSFSAFSVTVFDICLALTGAAWSITRSAVISEASLRFVLFCYGGLDLPTGYISEGLTVVIAYRWEY